MHPPPEMHFAHSLLLKYGRMILLLNILHGKKITSSRVHFKIRLWHYFVNLIYSVIIS